MTGEQFQEQTLRLAHQALLSGRCPACLALDLLTIVGAIQTLYGLSAEELLNHRQPAERRPAGAPLH